MSALRDLQLGFMSFLQAQDGDFSDLVIGDEIVAVQVGMQVEVPDRLLTKVFGGEQGEDGWRLPLIRDIRRNGPGEIEYILFRFHCLLEREYADVIPIFPEIDLA